MFQINNPENLMIECPSCQKEVYEKAVSCPSCGFPVEKTLAQAEAQKAKAELLGIWRKASLYIGVLLLIGGLVSTYTWFRFSDDRYASDRYVRATTGGSSHYTYLAAQAAITVHLYIEEQQAHLATTASWSFVIGAWLTYYGLKHRRRKV